jgi:hypothetical protein
MNDALLSFAPHATDAGVANATIFAVPGTGAVELVGVVSAAFAPPEPDEQPASSDVPANNSSVTGIVRVGHRFM